MRIALIAGGILALLLIIIGLFFLFSGSPQEGEPGYIAFPQSGERDIEEPGGIEYPDRPPGYRDVLVVETPRPIVRAPQEERVEPRGPIGFATNFASWFAGLLGGRSGTSGGSTTGGSTDGTVTGGAITTPDYPGYIGTTYTGGGTYSGPAPYYEVPGGGSGGGGDNNRDDIEFNPQTGDLWVAGVHFNFTGMQTVANNTTSDVVGDPDNLTLGTTIGTFVGALIGDPALGLLLGTALGSNLYNGFTLQDLGIGLDNGVPTFGGHNPLEEGGIFDGGGDEAGDEADSQGQGYFGGYAFAMNCTCPDTSQNYFFMVLSPEDYAGTYLMTPESKAYEEYGTVGFFSVLGSYDQGSSGDCELYVVEECIPVEIDKGTINAMPGYGTSGVGD